MCVNLSGDVKIKTYQIIHSQLSYLYTEKLSATQYHLWNVLLVCVRIGSYNARSYSHTNKERWLQSKRVKLITFKIYLLTYLTQ